MASIAYLAVFILSIVSVFYGIQEVNDGLLMKHVKKL